MGGGVGGGSADGTYTCAPSTRCTTSASRPGADGTGCPARQRLSFSFRTDPPLCRAGAKSSPLEFELPLKDVWVVVDNPGIPSALQRRFQDWSQGIGPPIGLALPANRSTWRTSSNFLSPAPASVTRGGRAVDPTRRSGRGIRANDREQLDSVWVVHGRAPRDGCPARRGGTLCPAAHSALNHHRGDVALATSTGQKARRCLV